MHLVCTLLRISTLAAAPLKPLFVTPRLAGNSYIRNWTNREGLSEQLPCRSAKVKISSVFLCQIKVSWIWREILVKFSVLRFPGFGCARENSPKFHVKNGVKNGKFHANFTLLGRSAEGLGRKAPPTLSRPSWHAQRWMSVLWWHHTKGVLCPCMRGQNFWKEAALARENNKMFNLKSWTPSTPLKPVPPPLTFGPGLVCFIS